MEKYKSFQLSDKYRKRILDACVGDMSLDNYRPTACAVCYERLREDHVNKIIFDNDDDTDVYDFTMLSTTHYSHFPHSDCFPRIYSTYYDLNLHLHYIFILERTGEGYLCY